MKRSTSWLGPPGRFYQGGRGGTPRRQRHGGRTEVDPRRSILEVLEEADCLGIGAGGRPGRLGYRRLRHHEAVGVYHEEKHWTEVSWRSGNPWSSWWRNFGVATGETGVRCRKTSFRFLEVLAKDLLVHPQGSTLQNPLIEYYHGHSRVLRFLG